MTTSRLRLVGRKRAILRLIDDDLDEAAEAAPLVGYGSDGFERAFAELQRVDCDGILRAADRAVQAFAGWCAAVSCDQRCLQRSPTDEAAEAARSVSSPSARFCIEALVLRIAAKRLGVSLVDVVTREPVADTLRTSAVIDPRQPGFLDVARELFKAGVSTFKLKGGLDPDAEVQAVFALRGLHPDVRVRVDANGSWTVEQAVSFMQRSVEQVEWFEDPVLGGAELSRVRSLVPRAALAWDEPFCTRDVSSPELSLVDVVVLKPMAAGGFSGCARWARKARQLGKEVCVSHLFDGPLALEACIALAFAIQTPRLACGLGRHAGLTSEPARDIEGLEGASLVR